MDSGASPLMFYHHGETFPHLKEQSLKPLEKQVMSDTPLTAGVSRGALWYKVPSWYRFRPRSDRPASVSVKAPWRVALQRAGTRRDHDFPVHSPSEQLLFEYFPYSSFTGKQYLIETG